MIITNQSLLAHLAVVVINLFSIADWEDDSIILWFLLALWGHDLIRLMEVTDLAKKWNNFSLLVLADRLSWRFQQVKELPFLLTRIRHALQFCSPFIGHLNRLLLHSLTLCRMSLFSCVVHNLLKILRVDRVEDIEEVLSARSFVISVLILEEDVELGVVLHINPQPLSW